MHRPALSAGEVELLGQGGVKKQKIRTVQKPQNRAENKFYGRYGNRRIARKKYGRYETADLCGPYFFSWGADFFASTHVGKNP